MGPKQCGCGRQGSIINSRQPDEHVTRRYNCECGQRWSTIEIRRTQTSLSAKTTNDILTKEFSNLDRENVADKLIELAQELLR